MSDNKSSVQPLYRQVAEQITEEIKSGIRPVDSKIPSERKLAEEFGISRMTARAAINSLVHQGLVIRRNRAGAYVSRPKLHFDFSSSTGLHEQLRNAGIEPGAQIVFAEKIPVNTLDPEIGQALALDEQDEVYRVVRLRTANGDPIAVENSYFPVNLFPDLLDFNLTDSIYGILKKYFSVESAGATQEIEITFLDAQWADIMDIPAGLPTLKIKRCSVTIDNKPFEFALDIFRGDRLIFTAQTVEAILNLRTPL